MVGFFGMFGKNQAEAEDKDLEIRDTLKGKYRIFQELLAENNRVLALMSEMEERL